MKCTLLYALFIVLFIGILPLKAQRNNIWCFGDSSGINFNNGGVPSPISTAFRTRGTCVSISDLSGNLLFYANTRSGQPGDKTGLIWNRNNQIMMNGDSIFGDGWYYEMAIIPDPFDDSSFYMFSIGVAISFGLTCCKIDMRGDGGLGEVVQKNISLLGNMRMVDCLLAVKHGNGRDWWVIVRESPIGQPVYNNSWYLFLVTPLGITNMGIQNIGQLNGTNLGNIGLSPDGSKICFSNLGGLIDLFDFDRCTGTFSNHVVIELQLSVNPYPYYWSNAFSPSGQYLYVSSSTNPESKLWQYDTWAGNILGTKTLIWQTNFPPYTIGALKRSLDNRIYISCAWVDPGGGNNYPYDSTEYYIENMNLSVINSPDLPGAACDFQPYSFYLGGKRTYWGLPNNPDYDLGSLVGSPCDTLVGITEPVTATAPPDLFVYFAPNWQSAFINAQHLSGNRYLLEVYDAMGKLIIRESGKLNPPYFTKNLHCNGYARGMYVVRLQTEKEKLVKRFVVE